MLEKEKPLQIINFQRPTAPTNHSFSETKMLKIANFVKYKYAVCPKLSKKRRCVTFQWHVSYNEPQP